MKNSIKILFCALVTTVTVLGTANGFAKTGRIVDLTGCGKDVNYANADLQHQAYTTCGSPHLPKFVQESETVNSLGECRGVPDQVIATAQFRCCDDFICGQW